MRRKVNTVDFEGKKPAKQTNKQKRNDLQMKTMANWQYARLHHLAVVLSDFITFWCCFNSSIESTDTQKTSGQHIPRCSFVLLRFSGSFYSSLFLSNSVRFLQHFRNPHSKPIVSFFLHLLPWTIQHQYCIGLWLPSFDSFVCTIVQLISFVNCTLYGGRTHSNWQQQ